MPQLGGSRPDLLMPVSAPQERVQWHTVVQIIDTFAPVPMLDAPAPLVVDQPVDVLKILDTMLHDVEQVVEVPKIILLDRVRQRTARWDPLPVEQLECQCRSRSSWHAAGAQLALNGARLLRGGGASGGSWAHATSRGTPEEDSPTAQGGIQILGKDDVVDVPVDTQLEFQQSKYEKVKVPQIQFLDRVPDIPVVPQRRACTVQTMKKIVEIPQVQMLGGRRRCDHAATISSSFSNVGGSSDSFVDRVLRRC